MTTQLVGQVWGLKMVRVQILCAFALVVSIVAVVKLIQAGLTGA